MNLKAKLLIATVLVGVISAGTYTVAQSDESNTIEQINSEVEEKIEIEIVNGVKKITVIRIENGVETITIYEGEEADAYLKEHHNHHIMSDDSSSCNFMFSMDEFDIGDLEDLDEEIQAHIQEVMENMGFSSDNNDFDLSWFSGCDDNEEKSSSCKMKIMIDGDFSEFVTEIEGLEMEMEELKDIIENLNIDISTNGEGAKRIIIISKEIETNGSEKETYIDKTITDTEDDDEIMKIYPNPSLGKFTIEMMGIEGITTKLSIVDMNGKVVLSKEYKDNGRITEGVNLKKESSGNYIVTVEQNGKILKEKILIK